MKKISVLLLSLASLNFTPFFELKASASDSDLDYILAAVKASPCSQIQVLISRNIGVIRWSQGSMRYLYDSDITSLKAATLAAGKRTIDVDQDFQLPDIHDGNWLQVEDQLEATLLKIFTDDYASHPPAGC